MRQSKTIRADVAIVGAGIIGLAHAYLAARAGKKVAVFERRLSPHGASLRNFGMIWPIGQPAGVQHRLALRSRMLWLELLMESGLHYRNTGSLHAAYSEDEAAVAREFSDKAAANGYECAWLSAQETLAQTNALIRDGLIGALWSPTEFTVDPREVLQKLPAFLEERYDVRFFFGCPVHRVDSHRLKTPELRCEPEHIVVATGDDFETLYPELFRESGVTRCKLQMMRTIPQPQGWLLGPSLAFGLTFLHYPAFEICQSRALLRERVEREMPDFVRHGIHVLVSQAANGQLTLGDSHAYSPTVDIFDDPAINRLILNYARERLRAPSFEIAEQWHGVYASHAARPWVLFAPCESVRVIIVTTGIGMTMSFGLAEQNFIEMGASLEPAELRNSSAHGAI